MDLLATSLRRRFSIRDLVHQSVQIAVISTYTHIHLHMQINHQPVCCFVFPPVSAQMCGWWCWEGENLLLTTISLQGIFVFFQQMNNWEPLMKMRGGEIKQHYTNKLAF